MPDLNWIFRYKNRIPQGKSGMYIVIILKVTLTMESQNDKKWLADEDPIKQVIFSKIILYSIFILTSGM